MHHDRGSTKLPNIAATLEHLIAHEFERHADRYAALVSARLQQELPALVEPGERRTLVAHSTRALLSEFTAALRLEPPRGQFHAPVAALAYVQHLARAGVPLDEILRAYRLGHELVYRYAVQLADGTLAAPEREAAVGRVGLRMFRFTDGVMSDVARAYLAEYEHYIRGTITQRQRLIHQLLAGLSIDTEHAERTLNYRLNRDHLAIVAWTSAGTTDPEHVSAATRPLTQALTHGDPLVITEPSGDLTLWISPSTRPPPETLAEPAKTLTDAGIHVALGEPGHGLEGFLATKRQADRASVIARLAPSQTITRYKDVALASLLLKDPDGAHAFANEELGSLAHSTPEAEELRAALSAYLANAHDQSRAARALGVHRNTVARRLAATELILGHPLDTRDAEIHAALTILQTLTRQPT